MSNGRVDGSGMAKGMRMRRSARAIGEEPRESGQHVVAHELVNLRDVRFGDGERGTRDVRRLAEHEIRRLGFDAHLIFQFERNSELDAVKQLSSSAGAGWPGG